ncbi:uncharacterized protein LOC113513169 [Galleria mellonella]|uniref:Uncharacterized protein LOC113513169 n=1 Tax=Galleria mellonella TaxID=7137 RepID=A0A6J1WG83_GALME|nr:uncharacterized protein LOC113513169 [Galleria mellonella]
MSKIENSQGIWSVTNENIDSKYEKCRNITEEIYKRINITFEIKKLETEVQSDVSEHSDQIDSNELSNETDLFACDKSDSISSSTEAEKPSATCEKYININNNEETSKKAIVVCKRPRKRFRKRVKKCQQKPARSESDGSSDEALPLSRMLDVDTKSADECKSESPDNVMGVPKIVIITKDLKPKIQKSNISTKLNSSPNTKEAESVNEDQIKTPIDTDSSIDISKTIDKGGMETSKDKVSEWKHCNLCSLSFRGERGLRRHLTMSHILSPENLDSNKPEQRHSRPI